MDLCICHHDSNHKFSRELLVIDICNEIHQGALERRKLLKVLALDAAGGTHALGNIIPCHYTHSVAQVATFDPCKTNTSLIPTYLKHLAMLPFLECQLNLLMGHEVPLQEFSSGSNCSIVLFACLLGHVRYGYCWIWTKQNHTHQNEIHRSLSFKALSANT